MNKKLSISNLLVAVLALIFLCSCNRGQSSETTKTVEEGGDEKAGLVEIRTENMDFQMPDTIPSGWVNFRYHNLSTQTHFFVIEDYPEGKTSTDAKELVAPVFDSAMALIRAGKPDSGFAEFAHLPEWFGEVKYVGGSGLVSPQEIGETSLKLKPGSYVVECYVKMSNGVFHSSRGMVKDLVVSDANSGAEEPEAEVKLEISSSGGIVVKDSIAAGEQLFAVHFKDQISHENFVGHDVHLVRLSANSDLDKLEYWMNWVNPDGLMEPAPAGVKFLGGVNDMPAGQSGYFSASLTAGKYALIAEVPAARGKNMLRTFTIEK